MRLSDECFITFNFSLAVCFISIVSTWSKVLCFRVRCLSLTLAIPSMDNWLLWSFTIKFKTSCILWRSISASLLSDGPLWVFNKSEFFVWTIFCWALTRVYYIRVRFGMLQIGWRWAWTKSILCCIWVVSAWTNIFWQIELLLWEPASLLFSWPLWALHCRRPARLLFSTWIIEKIFPSFECFWLGHCVLDSWGILSARGVELVFDWTL